MFGLTLQISSNDIYSRVSARQASIRAKPSKSLPLTVRFRPDL
jgi:hypothetical protein